MSLVHVSFCRENVKGITFLSKVVYTHEWTKNCTKSLFEAIVPNFYNFELLWDCYKIKIKQPNFFFTGRTASCLDNQVVVVGGGVAGLAATASLSEAGFDVVLLEAADYFGGRVKQVEPFKGFAPVDLGGEFIHGSDNSINRIAGENSWPVLPVRRSFVFIQFSLNKKRKGRW